MYTIVRREVFSDTTFLWEVMVPDVAKSAQPGHFVMIRLQEGSERIPLTVAEFDRDKGTITPENPVFCSGLRRNANNEVKGNHEQTPGRPRG